MKVALVHDYLREYGGAERVLEDLHEIFPDAPVYTAFYYPKGLGTANERINKWDIHTSWIQKLPFANKWISPLRIFAPMIFENFDLSGYDVIISSSAVYFAKAVLTKPGQLHIAYIHTPPRFLYGYTTSWNYKKHWWTRLGGELLNHFLRIYDFETSQRPDILIANSKNVASRIKKFYRRDSVIIHPPVDTNSFQTPSTSHEPRAKNYFLSLNRLVRGKGTEIAVQACAALNLPLKVAGAGPELRNLKKLAGPSVEFVGPVSDEERIKLFQNATALIVASEDEDFGITPVEAMAAGTPVIALRAGGYLETVIEGKTGQFFDTPTPQSLTKVLETFDPSKYKDSDLHSQAEKFSKDHFRKKIHTLISAHLNNK